MPPRRRDYGHMPIADALNVYGNQVMPTPAPSGNELQAMFDQWQRSQRRPLMEQKWGNTVPMMGWVAAGLLTPVGLPFVPMVNIGPFDEPRAIALEQSYEPVQSLTPIDLEHELTVGIGQAVATYSVSQLPPVVLAMQLQVSTKRVDAGFGLQASPISVWAAPHVPRMGLPTPILSENIQFGAGASDVTTATQNPPRGATHVMVSGDPVALAAVGTSTIWVRISYRPFPETASAGGTVDVMHQMVSMVNPAVSRLGVADATHAPSQPGSMSPTILPVPFGQIVQWRWFRATSENAAIGDHTITWLRA